MDEQTKEAPMTPFQKRIVWLAKSRPIKFCVDHRHHITMCMLAWYASGGLVARHLDTVCASVLGFVVLMALMANERLTDSQREVIKVQDELIAIQRERIETHDIVIDQLLPLAQPRPAERKMN